MSLESEDGEERFTVFMRKNETFAENFSIGLEYHPATGPTFTLLRCNGPHGQHVELGVEPDAHYAYHIHGALADRVNEGNFSERHATVVDGYASYEEALQFFIRHVGIEDADMHFAQPACTLSLFDPEGE